MTSLISVKIPIREELSLLHLPWDDVILPSILPLLDFKTLFMLRRVSLKFRKIITEYLKSLHMLDLSSVNNLPLHAIKIATFDTTRLRRLNLSRTNVDTLILAKIFLCNPRLTHVDLSFTENLTPKSIHPLIMYCPDLEELKLLNCIWFDRGCFQTLASSNTYHTKLKFVDIRGCVLIGCSDIVIFTVAYPNLKRLRSDYCREL